MSKEGADGTLSWIAWDRCRGWLYSGEGVKLREAEV